MLKYLSLALVGIVMTVGLPSDAWAEVSDEQVWQDFLKWLPSAQVSDSPAALLAAYERKLMAAGTTEAEAAHRREVVMRQMKTHDEGWQIIFNNIYSSSQAGFSIRPNATLMSAIVGRGPGRALDAGMGQGRNALYLALKGWDVTGFDISDGGLAIARRNAEKAGVKLTAVQKSEKDFDYGVSQWDLVLFSYVPFPVGDEQYVDRLYRAVRPGGLVVVESFASDAASAGRRPVDLDPAVLRRAFHKFRIVRLDDVVDTPDWSDQKVRLVRMVAEK
jgi:SAM-dependent methyltransferase